MTTLLKFIFTMIAIVMGYVALLTSANAESTKITTIIANIGTLASQ